MDISASTARTEGGDYMVRFTRLDITPMATVADAYERFPGTAAEGERYFVERLWPRGVSREALRGVPWLKDVAPSAPLRRWYGHDPARWPEFGRRYEAELGAEPASAAVATLLDAARRGPVTLLYAARDTERNSALVLKEHLKRRLA